MSKHFKTIVVDDEELARKDIKSILVEFKNVNVIGEAENVSSARALIKELKPDLIFLDIQMPGESGFDLLESIDTNIKVIFVTAYDEFAIRAFEVNAKDYLLKPVDRERLTLSLRRLEGSEKKSNKNLRKLKYEDSVFLLLDRRYCFLKVNTIKMISAADDYSEIVTMDGKKELALKSMKEWEARLPNQFFSRIHRSTIINIREVERIEPWFNHSFQVYLKGNEKPLAMSRRYAAKVKEIFS